VKYRVIEPCSFEVFDSCAGSDASEPIVRECSVGDELEVMHTDHPHTFEGVEISDLINAEFADGTVAFCLSTTWFEEIG